MSSKAITNIKYSGETGNKKSNYYHSIKAAVCPDAPYIGEDVLLLQTDGVNSISHNSNVFWQMPDGGIAHVFQRGYPGGEHWHGDFLHTQLRVCFSSDEGRTWTESVPMGLPDPLVAPGIYDANPNSMFVAGVLPDGEGGYLVFAEQRYDSEQKLTMLMCRTKDFVTYTPWQRTYKREGMIITNQDRIIRLKSGRLLIPAAIHDFDKDTYIAANGRVIFFYSDDNGETWLESPDITYYPWKQERCHGWQEPGVCELSDGRVWCFVRCDLGRQWQMFSDDGGETWSAIEPSRFVSPRSPMSMTRLSDGRLVAVWNPVPGNEYHKPMYTARTPIVISVSEDEGKTWSPFCVLDDAPKANYCYTAFYCGKDYLLLSYFYHSYSEKEYCNSKIKRVEYSEL